MRSVVPLLLMLLVSCGTTTGQMSMEDMRLRIEANRCRAVLEKASYGIMTWEYGNEEVIATSEALYAALPDTLVTCPVTLERYLIETVAGSRVLTCPSGHGSVTLREY